MGRDTSKMAETLRSILPQGEAIRGVERLSLGRSNETYFVDGTSLVLRLRTESPSLLTISAGLEEQYATLEELQNRRIRLPTPRVSHLDPTGEILGAPFFLMERLPGKGWDDFEPPDWARNREKSFGERMSRSVADLGAQLAHAQPLASVPTLNAVEELDRWRNAVQSFAHPHLLRSFRMLSDKPPAFSSPALVHGDLRLGNILWDEDGGARGLVDWELTFNGDPLWDLSWFLLCFDDLHPDGYPAQAVPGFWEKAQFIDHWVHSAGANPDNLPWFEAAAACKAACVLSTGFHLWRQGLTTDEAYRMLGPMISKWLDLAAERAARATA